MKNITLKVISFISLFLLFTSLISSKPLCFTSNKNESIITIDSTSSVGLPMRLRDIPTLNISGSAQFTKDQLLNLKNSINKDNICIVDLRQESHGMINDLAISFLNPYKDLNNGFTTEQTIKAENSLLNKIKIGNTIQLYKHTGIFIKDITVDFISNESQLVTEADMQYKRFAVKDNSAPTPDIVDEFVEFTQKHYAHYAKLLQKHKGYEPVSEYLIHWIAHMQVDVFIHLLTHVSSEEEAQQYIRPIVTYLRGGWDALFTEH